MEVCFVAFRKRWRLISLLLPGTHQSEQGFTGCKYPIKNLEMVLEPLASCLSQAWLLRSLIHCWGAEVQEMGGSPTEATTRPRRYVRAYKLASGPLPFSFSWWSWTTDTLFMAACLCWKNTTCKAHSDHSGNFPQKYFSFQWYKSSEDCGLSNPSAPGFTFPPSSIMCFKAE